MFRCLGVAVAAAVGMPDPKHEGSGMIKAFITPREDSRDTIRAEDVISYCCEKLPEHAVPRYVEFRDELPLTVTEKILKRALREEEVRKIKERETQGGQSVNAGETD